MRPTRRAALASLLLLPVLAGPVQARNEATPEDWRQDLRILLEDIEAIHPDPWFHADRAAVFAAADELDARLPDLTWEESFAEFHRITAMLHDGHTRIPSHRNHELGLRRVQVQYQLFPDGLHVIAVHPDHAEILGGRVTAIGTVSAEEAWARMEPLVPVDNEWTARDRTPGFLTSADLLVGLGILEDTDECPVQVEKDGRLIHAMLPTDSTHDEDAWPSVLSQLGSGVPLYQQHPERSYFLELLPERNAAYLCFRRVRNDEDESFEDFCTRAFASLDEHEVDRLIVDLRLNGGGNNFLNRPLIHGIIRNDRVNQEGHLYVIVGRRTFSAAMCGTIDLERQTEAMFAGEPTGAAANHHGDAVPVVLPHTGVTVSISALYWQNSDPRDTRPYLDPEIPVELTWDDYRNGRDPVLGAVLSHSGEKRESSGRAFWTWLEEGASLDAAIERYQELRASPEGSRYKFDEYQLNTIGYELLGAGRPEDAITVFELNAEMYPHAANPWDSLGEALAAAGRTEEAIAAYRRSVELNPASRSGQTALRALTR